MKPPGIQTARPEIERFGAGIIVFGANSLCHAVMILGAVRHCEG
jgi:hypothetical protein